MRPEVPAPGFSRTAAAAFLAALIGFATFNFAVVFGASGRLAVAVALTAAILVFVLAACP